MSVTVIRPCGNCNLLFKAPLTCEIEILHYSFYFIHSFIHSLIHLSECKYKLHSVFLCIFTVFSSNFTKMYSNQLRGISLLSLTHSLYDGFELRLEGWGLNEVFIKNTKWKKSLEMWHFWLQMKITSFCKNSSNAQLHFNISLSV